MSHTAQHDGSSSPNGQQPPSSPPCYSTETSSENVKSWMSVVNEGGDPITALAYRRQTSQASVAARLASVQQKMDDSLLKLKGQNNSGGSHN